MTNIVRWLKKREQRLTAAIVGTTGILAVAEVVDPVLLGAVNTAVALWIVFLFGPADTDDEPR